MPQTIEELKKQFPDLAETAAQTELMLHLVNQMSQDTPNFSDALVKMTSSGILEALTRVLGNMQITNEDIKARKQLTNIAVQRAQVGVMRELYGAIGPVQTVVQPIQVQPVQLPYNNYNNGWR